MGSGIRTFRKANRLAAIWIASALFSAASADAEPELDQNTGLVIAPGWEMAAAHCGGCHSHALVTAQRGDAEFWRSTIRWMQKTQNLWQIPAAQEQTLIAYLEENYNETDWGRRPPLPQSLMPAN
jgi:hypothetical protein